MQQYIVRRLLLMVPTLFIVTVVIFSLVRLMPGDVALNQLAQAPAFTKQDVTALRQTLGLNQSWPVQYGKWIGGIFQGKLGKSLWSRDDTSKRIVARAPVTIELALLAFVIANALAMLFGIISATHQDSPLDYVVRITSIVGLSLPSFWVGTLVIVLGSRWFHYGVPITYISLTHNPIGNIRQFIAPSLVIAIASSAIIMRLVRSSMLEILRQDFVRTAMAKGLRSQVVIYRHCLKNALMPVVTLSGYQLGTLLTGSVIVESIFTLPGLGRLTLDAISQRDYTQVQANTLIFAVMFLMINLLVDLSYGWLDPRIKY